MKENIKGKGVAEKAIRAYYMSRMGWLSIAIFAIIMKWKSLGLGLSRVILLQGIFALGILSFEIPTGAFSDVRKRKHVLISSTLLTMAGLYIYWQAQTFGWLVVAELIFALGGALASGTNTALVYEALKEENREQEVSRIYSTASAFSFAIQTVSFGIGGFITTLNPSYAFVTSIGLYVVTLLSYIQIIEPQRTKAETMNQAIRSGLMSVATKPLVIGYIATFTLIRVIGGTYFWAFQMQLPEHLDLQYIGIATAMIGIVGSVAGLWARNKKPRNALLVRLVVLYVFGALLFQFSQSLVVLFATWIILEWTRGSAIPLYNARIQEQLESSERATIGSIVSTIASLTYGLVSIGIGLYRLSPQWIIHLTFILGTTIGVIAIISLIISENLNTTIPSSLPIAKV